MIHSPFQYWPSFPHRLRTTTTSGEGRPARAVVLFLPARGFTLLEVTMVIVIMVVIAGIAWPRYASSLARYRADMAARQIADDIERAAKHANATSRSVSITFATDRNAYQSTELALSAASESGSIRLSRQIAGATLRRVTFEGSRTITFNGHGHAETDGVLVIQAGSEFRIIRFDKASGDAAVEYASDSALADVKNADEDQGAMQGYSEGGGK
jgi:prepilin-type N-terminal cleavage/methylation domain-containing protein